MESTSYHKYLRISPKKIKVLCRLTVGLSPDIAASRLLFIGGKAPKLLSAVIKSAKSNAVNNLKLNSDNLIIKEVVVGKGPHFKRWQPVSRGSAHSIKKRTTHLRVTVAEKIVAKKALAVPVKKDEEKNIQKDSKKVTREAIK